MSAQHLLNHLATLGVRVRVEGGKLCCSAPTGVLTPELRDQLKAAKPQLIALLSESVAESTALKPITRSVRSGPSACMSFAQERLWYLEQVESGSGAYNVPIALRLHGELDEDALRRSLVQLLSRHEALRTIFAIEGEENNQIVQDSCDLDFDLLDLSQLPAGGREELLEETIYREKGRAFDLQHGPVFRCRLLRASSTEHVLLLVAHHMVIDGWSLGTMLRELDMLYQANLSGCDCPLPALPVQYLDYSLWQRDLLRGPYLDGLTTYWRQQLSGELPRLDLPFDRLQPAVPSFAGAVEGIRLSDALSEGLADVAAGEGATLFMLLVAALDLLLARYTGQYDVVLGCPIAGREQPEIEHVVGFFANTIVLRCDLSGNPQFNELIERVRGVSLGAFTHQNMPFERLVEELHPNRTLTRMALFQVLLGYLDERGFPRRLGDLEVESFALRKTDTARLDLCFWIARTPQGLRINLEYSTELFERATICRLLGHFRNILEGVVENPQCRIADLALLSDDERQQILQRWNDTGTELPAAQTIHGFIHSSRSAGSVVAVESGDDTLTYQDLEQLSNQFANWLANLGIAAGSLVGVSMERSERLPVVLLGLLKLGAAYLPLDPDFPQQRLEFMIGDSGVQWLVTEASIGGRFAGCGAQSIMVDELWSELGTQSGASPEVAVDGESLAYVIYTSGSTGRPKGVQVTHRNVVSFLSAMEREPGLAAGDTLLAVTTLSFDIALLELLLPLVVGGRVVIASREEALDGRRLLARLERCEANAMQATPATWRLMIEAGWQGDGQFKVLCGGEALSRDLADALLARAGQVWNMYGPTETTVWSTCGRVEAGTGVVPIGRAIANTRVYVLDEHRQPVPVGVPGELYIGGAGVTRGYLNRPELTAERFLSVDLGVGGDERLYRTGDLVRYRGDGTLEYLSRMDHQVKVRGFRIELGEIEAVLGEHAGIRRVVVQVRELRTGDQRLVAYMVPAEASQFTVTELRKYLRGKLPDYMVPQHFVELDALPLTPNGKVDRKALPDPLATHDSTDREESEPPATVFECELASIWEEALGVERIGVDDNFFELGGHSLLALRVISRIREATGSEVALMSLALQSLGEIARHCEQAAAERAEPVLYSDTETVGLLGKFRGAWRSVSGRRVSR